MTEQEVKFREYIGHYYEELATTLRRLDVGVMWQVVQALQNCGGRIWLIGNGGSAALASHMATDLQLAGFKAQSLTDTAAITTHANDHSYEFSFVGQLDILAGPRDLLIAISGSGTSVNIVRATEWAIAKGLTVVGLTGFGGGKLATHLLLHAPVFHMGRAQDAQQVALHEICYWLMEVAKDDIRGTRPRQVGTTTASEEADTNG